jgi:predicted nucleotidyltransferase
MTIQELKDKQLILFECISGSKAYGLGTPISDTDIKGVFYLPKDRFYGLDKTAQVANESNDEVYYELGRFVELLAKNNPNILELLATPEDAVIYRHPIMHQLRIELCLSKLCRETFAGYAVTQIRKARGYKKKVVNPVDEMRKSVPDFCYIIEGHTSHHLQQWLDRHNLRQEQCGLTVIPHSKGLYAVFYDATNDRGYKGIVAGEQSNEVSLSSIPKGAQQLAYLFFNQESYSAYCKEYREYWDWVARRNENRYASNKAHGKDYDAKNMMHTIRLLQVAEEVLREGKLNVRRTNRGELLAIKRGEYEYNDLLHMAENLMERIVQAYPSSPLPEAPDQALLERILVSMRTVLYT